MSKMLKLSPLMLLGLIVVGCTTSTITNLTPSKQSRNPAGAYPIEVAWDSRQQTVRHSTLTPVVVTETQTYPMRPVMGMSSRWETVVPVSMTKTALTYRVRFDYEYNAFGPAKKANMVSAPYKLEILDK